LKIPNGVIRVIKSKKNRQHIGKKKKYLQTLPTNVHILSVITYKVKINKQFNNVIYLHKKKTWGIKYPQLYITNNNNKSTNK
jgi:hypothetical protein